MKDNYLIQKVILFYKWIKCKQKKEIPMNNKKINNNFSNKRIKCKQKKEIPMNNNLIKKNFSNKIYQVCMMEILINYIQQHMKIIYFQISKIKRYKLNNLHIKLEML